jgi:hypothetical protein
MSRLLPVCTIFALVLVVGASVAGAAEHHVALAPGEKVEIQRGSFSYTIEQVSPSTQSDPDWMDFLGTYFYFYLTNTSSQQDDFFLAIQNLTQPTWFGQVCLRAICFPDSTTLTFDPGEADTVGVNVVPDGDGVAEFDFYIQSNGDPSLNDTFHLTLYAGTAAVGAGDIRTTGSDLLLRQNVPNPVSTGTSISFVLPRDDRVSLRIYDVSGRLVTTLAEGRLAAGPHAVTWDGRTPAGERLPNGVYFYRLDTSSASRSRQLTVLR